jgi:polyisoprenoid-binding protein YceI
VTTQRPTSSRKPVIAGVVLAVVALVAAGGLWYLFLRPSGPAPVALGTPAPAASQGTSDGGEATEAPAPTGAPAATASEGGSPTGEGLDGTWNVDPSIGSFSDFSGSFVGYRVKETLANIGATEAVGRTPDVTGSLTLDGSTIAAAEFTADLTTLQSDNDRRDGQLERQALETGQFPTATFTLTAPIDLGSVPEDGATVEVTAVGDLTLHGVTRPVEIALQARLVGDVITVAGSLPIVFADFGIAKPQSMVVLSVEDRGTMELQLHLTRAG